MWGRGGEGCGCGLLFGVTCLQGAPVRAIMPSSRGGSALCGRGLRALGSTGEQLQGDSRHSACRAARPDRTGSGSRGRGTEAPACDHGVGSRPTSSAVPKEASLPLSCL